MQKGGQPEGQQTLDGWRQAGCAVEKLPQAAKDEEGGEKLVKKAA